MPEEDEHLLAIHETVRLTISASDAHCASAPGNATINPHTHSGAPPLDSDQYRLITIPSHISMNAKLKANSDTKLKMR